MLVFDGNVLCERAWATVGDLRNGVIFGFLKQFVTQSKLFPGEQCVAVFDSRHNKRRDLTRDYKSNRGMNTAAVKKRVDAAAEIDTNSVDIERTRIRAELAEKYRQIDLLVDVLRDLGIATFREPGYEGDDLIAAIIQHQKLRGNEPKNQTRTRIVSTDEDLYQLLSTMYRVTMLKHSNSTEEYTELDLVLEYDQLCGAEQWAEIKMLMGCKGDSVAGIPGIGLRTALKWLSTPDEPGLLCTPRIRKLVEQHAELIELNKKLVVLPFDKEVFDVVTAEKLYGTAEKPVFQSDMGAYQRLVPEKKRWNDLCMKLQMPSLKAK